MPWMGTPKKKKIVQAVSLLHGLNDQLLLLLVTMQFRSTDTHKKKMQLGLKGFKTGKSLNTICDRSSGPSNHHHWPGSIGNLPNTPRDANTNKLVYLHRETCSTSSPLSCQLHKLFSKLFISQSGSTDWRTWAGTHAERDQFQNGIRGKPGKKKITEKRFQILI